MRHCHSAVVALGALAALLLSACRAAETSRAPVLAISNVDVIPVYPPGVLENQTVIVTGERITSIAPAGEVTIPAGAVVLDGEGRFLIPGLADMHAHLPRGEHEWEPSIDEYFDLLLAAGVTTIRTMRGADGDVALREAIARHRRSGPRLIVGSPGLDAALAPDPRAARERVRAFHAQGYDFVKVLEGFDPDTFAAIVEEARATGMRLAGHVPSNIPLDSVLGAYWTVEHLHGHGTAMMSAPGTFPALAEETAAARLWVCPTLGFQVSWYGQETVRNMTRWSGMRYAHPAAVAHWTDAASKQAAIVRRARQHHTEIMTSRYRAVRALVDGDVGLLVSPSTGWFLVPGFGMFVEMRCLSKAGLVATEILSAATVNAARCAGEDDAWGSLRPGLTADMVLLEADPVVDITHVERIVAVVRRGQLFDRAELDRRLSAIEARHRLPR